VKINIFQKLIIFSFIVLVGNGVVGYTVYKSNKKRLDAERWVQHTQQVIYQSENIIALGIDIETSSRGFVITKDSSFLEPLFTAEKTVFAYIQQLRQLAWDNATQQQRLDSLRYYMQKRLDFSLLSIELRNKQGLAAAIAHVSTNRGKQYSDHTRQIINTIQKEEQNLLEQRKQTNENELNAVNKFSMIMFFLMTTFTILLLIITGKYLIQSKEKEKQASDLIIANEELAFQNEEKEKQEVENKELEAFSYSVSHDLRAPLRHIGGFVDLLIKNNSSQLDQAGLRYLNIISESAHEMGNLIDALLTFSRLSRTELQRTKINSKDMVTRVVKTFSDELVNRNIEINVSGLPDIMGDENLITQIWVNLISNALKYSRNEKKSMIDIGSETGNDKIIFYIKDNGVGFDMKYADKLFGVFQRLHKARDFEGIGIGLANVNRIVVRHGGTCWAESEVGNGAKFFFSVPNK